MYVGKDWDPSNVGENEFYTLDFKNEALASGETIASVVWTCQVLKGVDPAAASHISGSATISGTMTTQRVLGLLDEVTYRLIATATTSLGQIKILWSHVPSSVPN